MAWPGGTRACFWNVNPVQLCSQALGGGGLVGEHCVKQAVD